MADGRDLLLGPGGLRGFTVHTSQHPNAGTRRLMDWLGVRVEVDVSTVVDGVSCLVGGCEWRWDGLGDRAAAIEEHRAEEHSYIPAFKFSVRTDDGAAALEAMDAGLTQRELLDALPVSRPHIKEPKREEEVETVSSLRGQRWTREEIVLAIQVWAAQHGEPPTAKDWRKGDPTHPTDRTVATAFGTWRAGIEAAGFSAPVQGERRSSARGPQGRESGVLLSAPSPPDVKQTDATVDDGVLDDSPSPVGAEAGSRTDEQRAPFAHLALDADQLAREIGRLDLEAHELLRQAKLLEAIREQLLLHMEGREP